jgi:hypothetical protein
MSCLRTGELLLPPGRTVSDASTRERAAWWPLQRPEAALTFCGWRLQRGAHSIAGAAAGVDGSRLDLPTGASAST